jgi:F-type H+-transporting ATPase subunit b
MLGPLQETENWVALGFLLFLGLLAYLGVHRKLVDALDQRQTRIKGELDEARRLREEAQALLADFERKGRAAESEAEAIIASAKA